MRRRGLHARVPAISRRTRVIAGFAAAALAASIGTGVAIAASSGSVTAGYSEDSAWETGYGAKYTITNGTSQALDGWQLAFDLPAGSNLTSFWDAEVTSAAISGGTRFTAVNKHWNGSIAAGASTSFGFNVSGAGRPVNCTINGAACGGGSTPTNTPSPGGTTPNTSPSPTPPASDSPSPPASPSPSPTTTTPPAPPPAGQKVIGYFTNWGVYGRNYHVKNIHTSGSAARLTHIVYAFGKVSGGNCSLSDSYADYDKFYAASDSVDGVADSWDSDALRGNFGQLRRLKAMYPGLQVLFSFGGWTYSPDFSSISDYAAFADSCYDVVEDPRWADVFDGIDIDWEYPNACGLQCDSSGYEAFPELMSALRDRFGPDNLITAAITADGTSGGKIDKADYAGAAQYVDWYMPMTYDYFGAWAKSGPTAPNAPLHCYDGMPMAGFCGEQAIAKLNSLGIPAGKLLLGIGFYGRGWTGVTQSAPGGSATGPATGTYESGIEDYKVLKNTCPATGTVGGTAYAYCGSDWWGYDTPATITAKMHWARQQGLAGAFFWELTGDTADGELITAISDGLG